VKRTRSHWRFVLGGLVLSLVWASSIGAQEQPILRCEGRVTYVAPSEMLVALDSGGVVMLDLARMPQGRDPSDRAERLRRRDRFHPAPESSGHCHVHPTGQPVGSDNSIVGALAPKWMGTGDMVWRTSPIQIALNARGGRLAKSLSLHLQAYSCGALLVRVVSFGSPGTGPRSPGGGRVGRFATLLDVVNHDDSVKALGLTGAEAADVVEYLKSL
jgi:hypothetical protein